MNRLDYQLRIWLDQFTSWLSKYLYGEKYKEVRNKIDEFIVWVSLIAMFGIGYFYDNNLFVIGGITLVVVLTKLLIIRLKQSESSLDRDP